MKDENRRALIFLLLMLALLGVLMMMFGCIGRPDRWHVTGGYADGRDGTFAGQHDIDADPHGYAELGISGPLFSGPAGTSSDRDDQLRTLLLEMRESIQAISQSNHLLGEKVAKLEAMPSNAVETQELILAVTGLLGVMGAWAGKGKIKQGFEKVMGRD